MNSRNVKSCIAREIKMEMSILQTAKRPSCLSAAVVTPREDISFYRLAGLRFFQDSRISPAGTLRARAAVRLNFPLHDSPRAWCTRAPARAGVLIQPRIEINSWINTAG